VEMEAISESICCVCGATIPEGDSVKWLRGVGEYDGVCCLGCFDKVGAE
jgi:hypothetical protein